MAQTAKIDTQAPTRAGLVEAWTDQPRYGGVVLYVTDSDGRTWSIYDQSVEDSGMQLVESFPEHYPGTDHDYTQIAADDMEANASEYWASIEDWVLES